MWGWKGWPALVLLLVATRVAAADDVSIYKEEKNSYFGLTTSAFLVDTDVASTDLGLGLNPAAAIEQNPGGLGVRMGGMIDRSWGVEARLAAGLWHEVDRESDGAFRAKVQMDVDHTVGVYATGKMRFQLPFVPRPAMVRHFFGQLHVGMAHAQVKSAGELCVGLTCVEASDRADSGGFSWGAGLGVRLEVPNLMERLRQLRHVGLTLEYMDHPEVAGVDLSSTEASVLFFF